MKILSTFAAFTPESSGAATGFPAAHAIDLDPMQRWIADAYAGAVNVSSSTEGTGVTAVFLNRCNFASAKIQFCATTAFSEITYELEIALVKDGAGNRKGWFDLAAAKSGYFRILIAASQTLDDEETVPAIGNLIVGIGVALPTVSAYNPRLIQRTRRFESDAGGLVKTRVGRSRHIIQLDIGDEYSAISAVPKDWDDAVVFADLNNVADAWLVFPPDDWNRPFRSFLDCSMSFYLEERP